MRPHVLGPARCLCLEPHNTYEYDAGEFGSAVCTFCDRLLITSRQPKRTSGPIVPAASPPLDLNERWISCVDADIKANCPEVNGETMVSWEFAKAAIRGISWEFAKAAIRGQFGMQAGGR